MTDADYLVQAARQAGYNPLHLATIMQYESGLSPTRWGGKGGDYFGLIQFGPEERRQFGVEPTNTNFNTQTDAAIRFLQARGYQPNMGLADMYSTVLAGSPGHYNRADMNGSVNQHVAAMQRNAMPDAMKFLSGASGYAPEPPAPVGLAAPAGSAPVAQNKPLTLQDVLTSRQTQDLAKGLLSHPAPVDNAWAKNFNEQAQSFHQAQVAAGLRGLL